MKRAIAIDAAVESALERWASQKRQMYVGAGNWAPRSILGKLMDEGPGAASVTDRRSQRWGEMYRGDGLIVQRIVVTLSYLPRMTLTAYYLFRGPWHQPVKAQCHALGITRAQFWPGLHAGEEAVSVGLQLLATAA